MATETPSRTASPGEIRAVPVRHPGRWIASVVIAVLALMFVHMLVTNPVFQWEFMFDNMFSPPVLRGAQTTLIMTVLAMVLGVVLGIIVAVMRLSPNPVVSGAAWTYVWFFRAIPRIVLLFFVANLGALYATYELGFPFDQQLMGWLGLDGDLRFLGLNGNQIFAGFFAGLLGLVLSEAAYMAEIVRSGIQAVDPGQTEAASALGMSRGRALRRIVLPQAMRVIIPPTGNDFINMLKGTSMASVIGVTELIHAANNISSNNLLVMETLLAAAVWYMVVVTVAGVGQHYLERAFGQADRGPLARAGKALRGVPLLRSARV